MSAAEKLPERPVELIPDDGKLLSELAPHALIQFRDDPGQCLFGLNQVFVLTGKECVPLGNGFIILNRIDVDVAQFPDRLPESADLFPHGLPVAIFQFR